MKAKLETLKQKINDRFEELHATKDEQARNELIARIELLKERLERQTSGPSELNESIRFRLSSTDKERFELAAKKRHLRPSDLMRFLVREYLMKHGPLS